jgi:hypothetical protein
MSCCRSGCGLFVSRFLAIQVFRSQWLMRQRFHSVDERPGCTDLAQESFVEPVCWNLFHSLEMVLWLTFRVRATSFWDSPTWRRPISIFRVAGSNLSMAAYQLSNKSQASNLVLVCSIFALSVKLLSFCITDKRHD